MLVLKLNMLYSAYCNCFYSQVLKKFFACSCLSVSTLVLVLTSISWLSGSAFIGSFVAQGFSFGLIVCAFFGLE